MMGRPSPAKPAIMSKIPGRNWKLAHSVTYPPTILSLMSPSRSRNTAGLTVAVSGVEKKRRSGSTAGIHRQTATQNSIRSGSCSARETRRELREGFQTALHAAGSEDSGSGLRTLAPYQDSRGKKPEDAEFPGGWHHLVSVPYCAPFRGTHGPCVKRVSESECGTGRIHVRSISAETDR